MGTDEQAVQYFHLIIARFFFLDFVKKRILDALEIQVDYINAAML